ncbi:ATP-binding cassette domain-containing protein [candidate division KSB1 bacterium]|nr:ATP-binding cassette domain-containing protein [candidate division KSB1 bacterium]
MIEIDNISFTYTNGAATGRRILNNISLIIRPGESIAVMGPNGSGKTTFARCLNGLLLPMTGTVTVKGLPTNVAANLPEIRRQVGMVFQNPDNQIVSATVEREIAFGLENLGLPRTDMREIVNKMLADFELTEYRKKSPHYLSGGEKQRLAMAAVLAMRPSYLVLDEPTSLLDPKSRRDILEIIKQLHRRKGKPVTTLLITQFPDEALTADRLIIFHNGEIFMDDKPETIFKRVEELFQIGLEPPIEFALNEILKR